MASMRLSNNKKKMVTALVNQANQALAVGRGDIITKLCRRIEAIQPNHPDALNIRGILCMQAGQPEQAEKLFLAAIEGAPKRSLFHANLGALYLMLGLHLDALTCYEKAMELDPHPLSTQYGYGTTLIEAECHEEACTVLEKARKRNPRDIDLLMSLYRAYYKSNHIDEARECLHSVLEIEPTHAEACLELAAIDVEAGQFEKAKVTLRKNLKNHPTHASTLAALAAITKHVSKDDPDVKSTISIYDRSTLNSPDRKTLAFTLGRVMDKLGDYDAAFSYLKEGHAIALQNSPYNNQQELAHLRSVIEAFTPEALSRTSEVDDATPVFIVGMPRCGSTLTEQILAAHPDTGSKGEWGFFQRGLILDYHRQRQSLTPEKLASFTPEQWRACAQAFLKNLKEDHPSALRITDKSLRNISLIGAIYCAIPKARIIHVRRHPLDTCLSIYKTNLKANVFDYGRDLTTLGHYYRMYLKLMQHWREVLPAGVMYELDYESLVTNQEEETRKLLDACGLDWDERCLQFNQVENIVRTSSVLQVRRGMYKDSLAAWKRYEEHLEPLIRILGTEYGHAPIGKP